VYNFEVEELHTYFVGESGWGFSVWAHNNACDGVNDLPITRVTNVKHHPNSVRHFAKITCAFATSGGWWNSTRRGTSLV